MEFDWDTPIGGAAPIDVRNALKPVAHHPDPLRSHLAGIFGQAAAEQIIDALLDYRWIERTGSQEGEPLYLTTEEGLRFVSASPRRFKRATALKALDGLLQRAKEVNDCSTDEYAYTVARLVVYGSILDPSADKVGDVDIAYQLGPRFSDPAAQRDAEAVVRAQARRQGRRFPSHFREIFWPQTMVYLHLKRRSPILSILDLDEPWLASRPHRIEIGPRLSGDPPIESRV